MTRIVHLTFGLLAVTTAALGDGRAPDPHPPLAPGARVHLHAHNCYPEGDQWRDRLARAVGAGAPFLAIEQDVMWVPPANAAGRSVVAHDAPRGGEPSLESHFFEAVRPMMEAALAKPRPESWPLLVLHLDFKTNEREHHDFVWDLLGRHERWLTTAIRTVEGDPPSILAPGPLLVLTEHGEGQERDFHDRRPVGSRLRLFGTVPPDVAIDSRAPADLRAAALVRAPIERLVPSAATSYRRWTNHSWAVVEEGGPPRAGAWTPAERDRLSAIVRRAHGLGLWVRFYTLNGYSDAGRGWSAGYNLGSPGAVARRWRAAAEAGVDFIATDQYEALGALLQTLVPPRPAPP